MAARRCAPVAAGCGSGEEPYSLALLWTFDAGSRYPALGLGVTASDADPRLLERARRGCYAPGTLKTLPRDWIERAFVRHDHRLCLEPRFRAPVAFALGDARREQPPGPFDRVLCRNLVLTYFDESLQREVLARMTDSMPIGATLVVGTRERLPRGLRGPAPWPEAPAIFRRIAGP